MYLLDSNVLKEAKNRYYGFAICPGFWDWLQQANASGNLASVEKIREEIDAGDDDDDLKRWIHDSSPLSFLKPDAETVEAMKEVTRWVMEQDYDEKNRAAFFAKADPLLIARAKAHGDIVVTHEAYVPANSKKVKIPNVCEAMEVEWIDCFQMLNTSGAQFVLGTATS